MTSARKAMRVVVDTNLFISGTIIKRGKPFELLEAWRGRVFTLLISDQQRGELEDVLQRDKIQKNYHLSPDEIASVLRLLETAASRAGVRRQLPVKVRDAKDEMILASALGGKAEYLVTGDDDLLTLRDDPRLGALKIVTVGEFLEVLAAMSSN